MGTGLKKSSYLVEENGVVALKMDEKRKEKAEVGAELAEHKPHVGKRKTKKLRREEREKTKGSDWYNMPALELTEERKRDLELLQMRGVPDPKRFYKKNTMDIIPKYFQIGTIVDSAADFYTDRMPMKDRKKTMVDELLADAEFKKRQKRKYVEIIQDKAKKQGKKFFKKKKRA